MHALQNDIELIKASGLFDNSWYTKEYPDVVSLGLDPIEHYLRFGTQLLRNPSPKFDTGHYLTSNPDVAEAGLNPLVHYAMYGLKEGRPPLPFVVSSEQYSERVDVVVPVFNALAYVKKCMEAIRTRRDGFAVKAIVVNDGSDEITTAWLREYCQDKPMFQLIEHASNQGYTKAVNTGLRASTAQYVVTLNSDTLVTRGWLRGLVRCITSDPKIGIVGPLSNAASWQNVPELYDESGAFAVNKLPSSISPDDMAGVVAAASKHIYPRSPFVNGFCFMIKRQVIDAVGFMDEENFPDGYGEENDYCIRAADAGFELAIADECYVFHAKSKSFGHERRKELSQRGSETLKRKHTPAKFNALVQQVRNTAFLDSVRAAVKARLTAHDTAIEAIDIMSISILFLLPVSGGGGGAHSVVQEVAEMRKLGIKANVAVKREQVEQFLDLYGDVANAQELFVGFDGEDIIKIAGNYHVVVGTIFGSMELVKKIIDENSGMLAAYYVQDYEPLFFLPNSMGWKLAQESYSLVPEALLFAKTRWIAEKVHAEHGIRVHKVQASIDHEIYKPSLKPRDGRIHVASMIRPQTPRRGAERTMRVLSRLAKSHADRIAFHLFGCADESPEFEALQRDFKFRNYGVISRTEVATVLSKSHVFIDLSDYQAFGRTALEAMACGCVAVVPAHGGTDEYAIDGVNALVVDSLNEEDCLERITSLIADSNWLMRLQIEGLLTASRFTARGAALSELAVLGKEYARIQRLPRIEGRTTQALVTADPTKEAHKRLPITALVITWDIGHNPLGRSYMLAEVLNRVVRNVVIMGFQFSRYGEEVWEPVRNGRLPVISLPGKDLPEFLDSLESISKRVQPDIVIACKPRLPSLQLGAMIKQKLGCPLVLDIDDHELSFFDGAGELAMADLAKMREGSAAAAVEPYGELWTRLAQNLRRYADEIIVSNTALHTEFGGTVVPHVRDEIVFNPALYQREASRRKYNIPQGARVVLFFGTPRHHKGINVLAEAVNEIDDKAFKLVVVGSTTDRSVTAKLERLAPGRIIHLPNQPFSAIPEVLAFADVVCLAQDEESRISQYQLPAKAVDALAMGIPLLVTRTPPLMQLVLDGVAREVNRHDLSRTIRDAANENAVRRDWAERVRPIFLARYSYAAAAKSLHEVIVRALTHRDRSKTDDLSVLLEHQRRLLAAPLVIPKTDRAVGIDVVVFWKQNDTDLYGRRSDMLIRYLASRDDVRRVVVFDAPISEHDLLARRNRTEKTTHDRLLYVKTYEKLLGKLDRGNVSYNVFVYPPGVYRSTEDGTNRTRLVDAYIEYLTCVFDREGVRANEAVFWLYPKNFMAPELVDHFAPRRVAVDVVDDHRAWPGIADSEYKRLSENYRETLSRAHMAFVNCEPMVDAMREFFPAIRMVPNGCDPDPPKTQPRNDLEFDEFMARGGKAIGFVGNLEQKIDIPLVAKIAERFSDCQIVLLGSTHANPQVLQLKRYPNVRMPGVVPYEQVGAWISQFDVGIIPHLDMEMTRSMNPLKLYVYLSWYVPVVSTEIYNIDSTSKFVRVARTHDDFLEHVASALQDGRIESPELQRYIEENCWATRFGSHVDELFAEYKGLRLEY
jgi:glycosyltransferase involved in cell wall biosynthesis/GT2 family glycosyltransferase